MVSNLLQLLRVKDWSKNVFIWAPIIFSGHFKFYNEVLDVLVVTIFFSIVSSCIYIFNDIHDYDDDRLQTVKSKSKPIANGDVSVNNAYIFFIILFLLFNLCWLFNSNVAIVLNLYFIINIIYTLKIKQIVILDIFTISTGFLLRVFAGGLVINVQPSPLMLITTLSLALFLSGIKRKSELVMFGCHSRLVLSKYSIHLLDFIIQTSLICCIVFYTFFTISANPEFILTVPLVMYCFFRYIYLFDKYDLSLSPFDTISKDIHLVITIIIWFLMTCYFIGAI